MSNVVLPEFAGLTWPRLREPTFSTEVQRSSSLRTWRVGRALYPSYRYRLAYAYLSADDMVTMGAFFRSRRGRLDSFLFNDRDDNTVATPQVVGIGNGTLKKFQLVRSLGGFVEPVGPVNGTPIVRVNGTPTVDFTVDDYGMLTLGTAPPATHQVDWTGAYYWRVCFTKDAHEYSEFMRNFWELRQLEFETEKA